MSELEQEKGMISTPESAFKVVNEKDSPYTHIYFNGKLIGNFYESTKKDHVSISFFLDSLIEHCDESCEITLYDNREIKMEKGNKEDNHWLGTDIMWKRHRINE